MKAGNKVTAYKYNKNDELLRTDTLNDRKGRPYIDIDVTLGDNRLNENVVNHYNALNQLTQTLTKNYKVSFTYDAEGLRTSKTVNGERTVFVWNGDQLVMELSAGGKVKKRYIRGNDLIFADKGTENASGEASGKQYYVTDPHGNVVQLTDEAGNVIRRYEYDSFGNEIKPDSKDDNPFRYCGEYYDKETEEIYLRARYYQPEQGRFLTRDTYTGEEDESLSLHLYTYCENDGVNAWDPSGHVSKNKIKQKLVKLASKDRSFMSSFKAIYSVQEALSLTLKTFNRDITFSSKMNEVEKCIIQSVIFRELSFLGVDDVFADTAVSIGLKKDSSTGPGQIFARTAIKAYNAFFPDNRIEVTQKNINKMWLNIRDDTKNIFFVGLELKRIIEIEYNLKDVKKSKSDYIKIFARYNGVNERAQKYGQETYRYYKQFKKLGKVKKRG